MGFALSDKSVSRLNGVHPDLVRVVDRAIQLSEVDFTVLEGLRTKERQQYLLQKGATKTLNSRHLTGHAVDLGAMVDGRVTWEWDYYHKLAAAMKKAAAELGVEIRWGGSWKKLSEMELKNGKFPLSRDFPDGPHFEIPR